MNYLAAVNQVLRRNGIIGGSGDDLTDFGGALHEGPEEIAKIAIRDEIQHLCAYHVLPVEREDATITLTTSSRVYQLDAGFREFQDVMPWLVKLDGANVTSTVIIHYPGGEERLRKDDPEYTQTSGQPLYWYQADDTIREIGLYPIPAAAHNNEVYKYYYQASTDVTLTTDTLPFSTDEAANAFCEAAARRMLYMPNPSAPTAVGLHPGGPDLDPVVKSARALVIRLEKNARPARRYSRRFLA